MDITNPMSIGVDVIGDSSTYSEALHNRHAFTYQADYGEVDRFVIPVNAYGQDVLYSSALYLYEIWDKTNPSVARLHPQGLLVPENAAPFSGYRQRAYLHNDSVFYVHDNDVYTGRWSSPSQTFGPFQ